MTITPITPDGGALSAGEQSLVQCLQDLLAALELHGDALAPFAQRNAIHAAAALWQVSNGLGLQPEHRYDLGL